MATGKWERHLGMGQGRDLQGRPCGGFPYYILSYIVISVSSLSVSYLGNYERNILNGLITSPSYFCY